MHIHIRTAGGSAISISHGTDVTIKDNEIHSLGGGASAIYAAESCRVRLSRNHIHDTTLSNGILLLRTREKIRLEDNLIVNNRWTRESPGDQCGGNAILGLHYVATESSLTVSHNTIARNGDGATVEGSG